MKPSGFLSRLLTTAILPIALLALSPTAVQGAEKLVLSSTTSTLDSGFFDAVLPVFEKKFNCRVKVIAVGTGQAIRLGRDGNADVLLVHDPVAEKQFVDEGFGEARLPVMHNDFLLVGPTNDPAGIAGLKAVPAFQKLASSGASFVSRGDQSGTHKKELRLWQAAGVVPSGKNYMESGSGMEATLRVANEKVAYTLIDRATWLAHQKEISGLKALSEGDPEMFNPYAVIVVSQVKYPHVKHKLAVALASFLRGAEGQALIRDFGKEKYGSPLFFPDVIQ